MADSIPNNAPLVSIIVAVRNAQDTLEGTLRSALAQDYANKEIVVIDGASTDSTLQVAQKFRNQLSVLISEPDEGIADAYNKGIRNARGDWLYFLNADDTFQSDHILTQIFSIAAAADCDLVVGKVISDSGRMFDGKYGWALVMRNTVHHQAIFYRRHVLRNLEYNTQYRRYGHDHEHNLRLWRADAKVDYRNITVALWKSGGVSDRARWRDYKEEFRVRRNALGRMGWIWNGFTVARYFLKMSRTRWRRH